MDNKGLKRWVLSLFQKDNTTEEPVVETTEELVVETTEELVMEEPVMEEPVVETTEEPTEYNKCNAKLYEYNGESHTLLEWSNITGINIKTISSRIYGSKWNIEKTLTTPINAPTTYEYNGESHTLLEWSDITGISVSTLYGRINKYKWDIEKTLTTPIGLTTPINAPTYEYNGESHTLSEWSNITGIKAGTLWYRINRLSWDVKKALTTSNLPTNHPPRTARTYEYNGESHTLSEWSNITGIKAGTLWDRIYRRKWDIEKALTTPSRIVPTYKNTSPEWKESSDNWDKEEYAVLDNAYQQNNTDLDYLYNKLNGRHSKDAIQLKLFHIASNPTDKQVYKTREILQYVYENYDIDKLNQREYSRIYSRLKSVLDNMGIEGRQSNSGMYYSLTIQDINNIKNKVREIDNLCIDIVYANRNYNYKSGKQRHFVLTTPEEEARVLSEFDDEQDNSNYTELERELREMGIESLKEAKDLYNFINSFASDIESQGAPVRILPIVRLFQRLVNAHGTEWLHTFENTVLKYGKCKGHTLLETYRIDKKYFKWLLDSNIDYTLKMIALISSVENNK